MFVEQKALLVSLENMSDIIESMDKKFFLKALGSFSCRLPAEQQAERLLTLTERKKELLLLRINVYESLDALKPDCRRILVEKYGIDGAKEDENVVKNRNYYRKLALAIGKFAKYITKYMEKSGERLVFGGDLPTYFFSDVMEEDAICPYGVDGRKVILADNFTCIDDGTIIGTVSPEVIDQMPKGN